MLNDDHYGSEDSECTQGSDLEFDINIQVLLPDGTVKVTSVVASTPWGDLKTKLCSQFKVSPTTHLVDFTSTSKSSQKRNASCPVGKMHIELVTIREKTSASKTTSFRSSNCSTESTVRLMVRLARFRQSVLRVHPDGPLSEVFCMICEKLKFDDNAKKRHELRHPTQHDLILDLEHSLNYYKIREVFLAEKPDKNGQEIHAKSPPPPPARTKRKAPLPPSSSAVAETHSTEPAGEEADQKPKARKRAAPPPPPRSNAVQSSVDASVDTSNGAENTKKENQITQDEQHEKDVPDDEIPRRPPRRQKQSKTSNSDDCPILPNNVTSKTKDSGEVETNSNLTSIPLSDIIVDDDVTVWAEPEDANTEIFVSGAINDSVSCNDSSISDNSSLQNNKNDVIQSVVDDVIETTLPDTSKVEETSKEDFINSIDDVLNEFNDVIEPDSDITSIESETHEEDLNAYENVSTNTTKFGDIVIYDVGENGAIVTDDVLTDAYFVEKSDSLRDEDQENVEICTSTSFDDLPPPPPAFLDVTNVAASTQVEIVQHENNASEESFDEMGGDALPLPDFSEVKNDSVPTDCENEKSSQLSDQEVLSNCFANQDNCGADKTTDKNQAKVAILSPEQVKDVSELTETEKTALEIERLHLQIKKMKNRNSQKQDTNQGFGRKSWHPGTKSFTLVPAKKSHMTYDDYKVAPVPAIELSNNGEINTLHREESEEKVSPQPQEAYKTRSSLPSYYKKFLGMNSQAKK